jgi:hypothetical protein
MAGKMEKVDKWKVDMRHIDGPRVSNNEWIRKCQYQELRWARFIQLQFDAEP